MLNKQIAVTFSPIEEVPFQKSLNHIRFQHRQQKQHRPGINISSHQPMHKSQMQQQPQQQSQQQQQQQRVLNPGPAPNIQQMNQPQQIMQNSPQQTQQQVH